MSFDENGDYQGSDGETKAILALLLMFLGPIFLAAFPPLALVVLVAVGGLVVGCSFLWDRREDLVCWWNQRDSVQYRKAQRAIQEHKQATIAKMNKLAKDNWE